jgi:hypothetical protein
LAGHQEEISNAPILIAPHWDLEFYVHTDASNIVVGTMLVQNPTRKCDQPISYASYLLNSVERNYTTIERGLWLWFMLSTNTIIICWATSLCFMWITWLWVPGQQATGVKLYCSMVTIISGI